MHETLNEVRERIARDYLGMVGIHGIGMSRARNSIKVHVQIDGTQEQQAIFTAIRQSANPFEVLIIEDKPSMITSD
jgi:hypothetical protein